MHRDILKSLVLLLVVRRLVMAAEPAPDPWRSRAGRQPVFGSDVTGGELRRATLRPRVTSEVDPADPTADSGAARERGRRGRRRGGRGRGRRRGCRAGREWRTGTANDNFLVGHINIQSLKNKMIDLRRELDVHDFDVISINETWLRKSTTHIMSIPGYRLIRSDRVVKPLGYGGVAVLARESLNAKLVQKPAAVNASKLESVWTEMRVANHKSVLFCSLYRPPTKLVSELDADLDELENQVQSALSRYSGLVVFSGDLNCNLNTSGGSGDRLMQLLSRYSLFQCIKPCSVTYRPASSMLDVIVANRRDSVVRTGVFLCDYSPHNFVRAMFRIKKVKPVPTTISCRSFSKINWDALRFDLVMSNWDPMNELVTLDSKSEVFTDLFMSVFNHHAPLKTVTIKHHTALPLTADTIQLLGRRRAAARGDRELTYDLLNRQCRSAIRRDCRDDVTRKLRERGGAATWSITRSLLSGKGSVTRPVPLVSVDVLNSYFATIGTRTSAAVISTRDMPILLPRVSTCSFKLSAVSYTELRRVVMGLRNTSTCGVDGITSRMVKNTFSVIGHILLRLVNDSLINCTVPNSWKISLVYPIHKGGALNNPAQFRPISVVPLISKVTERIVQKQLYDYFSDHDLFSPAQHAYRRNHSTETALLTVSDYILTAMNRREVVLVAMLDCSKCFDTINHETLLNVLNLYGVETEWFRSYLSDHFQRVQIYSDGKTNTSETESITTGIYQGTALGPLLFSIFSNDMYMHMDPSVTIINYADDSQLLVRGSKGELPKLISRLESALDTARDWFSSRKMKINASKTQLVVFGTAQLLRNVPQITVKFDGEIITETHKVRNLGLTMDRYMTFRPHMDQVTGCCTGILLGLSAARHWLPQEVMVTLVNSLVLSRLRYCLTVYGNASCEIRERVQKLVNFSARVVTGRRKRDHISDAVRSLEWLRAADLYQYSAVTRFQAVITSGEPVSLAANITVHQHGHNTRHENQFRPPPVRTELGKRMFAFSAPTLYNALPLAVRAESRGRGFKRALKKHLLNAD